MCRTKPQNIRNRGANTIGEASGSSNTDRLTSSKPDSPTSGSFAIMKAMEAFLSDSDMSDSGMTFNSQGSYMVTDATTPLDTSIRVNDDFHCISDDYQGLVKVGNAGIWFLIDSGSAVTFIAEFVAQHSNSAKIAWKE